MVQIVRMLFQCAGVLLTGIGLAAMCGLVIGTGPAYCAPITMLGGPLLVGIGGTRYLFSFAGFIIVCCGWVIVFLNLDTYAFYVLNVSGMIVALVYGGTGIVKSFREWNKMKAGQNDNVQPGGDPT